MIAATVAALAFSPLAQALAAEEAKQSSSTEEELAEEWLVEVILWDAVRNPIEKRRSRPPDPRIQPSIERLERQLGRLREKLIRLARAPAGDSGDAGKDRAHSRKRIDAVGKLAVLAGMTDDKELRELVIGLLGDPDGGVRVAAAIGTLQFEDQAESAVDGLLVLLERYGGFQEALLVLTRVDPRGEKSYRAILRMIGEKRHVGPAPWINALAEFRWDEKTPAAQRREVLRFLDRIAGDARAGGRSTAAKVAKEIRARMAGVEGTGR